MMNRILFILLLFPLLSFSQSTYKILADSTRFGSINNTGNELIIQNDTRDSTTGVLTNVQTGRTNFQKLRLQQLTDTTFRLLLGTNVQGQVITIPTVAQIGTTYTLTKKGDSIVLNGSNGGRYAVKDTTAFYSIDAGNGLTVVNDSTLRVDTSVISTKANVAGLVGVYTSSNGITKTGANFKLGGRAVDPNTTVFVGDSTSLTFLNDSTNSSYTAGFGSIISNKTAFVRTTREPTYIESVLGLNNYSGGAFAKNIQFKSDGSYIQAYFNGFITDNTAQKVIAKANDSTIVWRDASTFGTVTSVATTDSTGINGGTISSTGTLSLDTTRVVVSKRYLDSRLGSVGGGSTYILSKNTAGDSTVLTGTPYSRTATRDWGWQLISTSDASNSATIDFTLDTLAGYTSLMLRCGDLIMQTSGANLLMRLGTGSTPTYAASINNYTYFYQLNTPLFELGTTTSVKLLTTPSTYSLCNIEITFDSPFTVNAFKNYLWRGNGTANGATTYNYYTYGGGTFVANTQAISGIQILMSGGNIVSGKFKLYGLK